MERIRPPIQPPPEETQQDRTILVPMTPKRIQGQIIAKNTRLKIHTRQNVLTQDLAQSLFRVSRSVSDDCLIAADCLQSLLVTGKDSIHFSGQAIFMSLAVKSQAGRPPDSGRSTKQCVLVFLIRAVAQLL